MSLTDECLCPCVYQLVQAAEGKFNPHIHVEYEWSLRLEEMDESDDDLDDKVRTDPQIHMFFRPILSRI